MRPHRFHITHLTGGTGTATLYICSGIEADSAWKLARLLVENDAPDAPIEAGRVGKTDWTFPSLHQFAVGAVSSREIEDAPERLHPALRAAVVKVMASRAARRLREVA